NEFQPVFTELRVGRESYSKVTELFLVAYQDGTHPPVLVNDAFLIISATLIDEHDLLVFFLIGAIGDADRAEVEAMDLDDVHRHRTLVGTCDVAMEEAGQDGGLLFRGGGEAKEVSLEFGDLADRMDMRVAGPEIGIDDEAAAMFQTGGFRDLDVGNRADGEDQGVTIEHATAAQTNAGELRLAIKELNFIRVIDRAALVDDLVVQELAGQVVELAVQKS